MAANHPQVDIPNEEIPEAKQSEIQAGDEFGEFDEGNVDGSRPIQMNTGNIEHRAGHPANGGEQGVSNEPNQMRESLHPNQIRQEPVQLQGNQEGNQTGEDGSDARQYRQDVVDNRGGRRGRGGIGRGGRGRRNGSDGRGGRRGAGGYGRGQPRQNTSNAGPYGEPRRNQQNWSMGQSLYDMVQSDQNYISERPQ